MGFVNKKGTSTGCYVVTYCVELTPIVAGQILRAQNG